MRVDPVHLWMPRWTYSARKTVLVIAFLIVLEVIFCLFIVLFVLLHRGTGGGLSDMFGGGGGALGGSAVVEKNLDRITIVAILGAMVTNFLLVKFW